jgi:hypothetical protein
MAPPVGGASRNRETMYSGQMAPLARFVKQISFLCPAAQKRRRAAEHAGGRPAPGGWPPTPGLHRAYAAEWRRFCGGEGQLLEAEPVAIARWLEASLPLGPRPSFDRIGAQLLVLPERLVILVGSPDAMERP